MSDTVELFADAWKLMVGRLPSASLENSDGVASCFGNVPLIFLNACVVKRPAKTEQELQVLLDTAVHRTSKCKHPAGVILREDWLPATWEAVIEGHGLQRIMQLTGMEAEELKPPRRELTALDIRRVTNDTMARELALLNADAYHMPKEPFECIANMHLWHEDTYGFVGYVDGDPVSCAAAFPVAGTVYMALVATHPEAQGKGYAEAVMRHAVTSAKHAMRASRSTLHATDMGLPVYKAMGYVPGARLVFLGPASSA